MFFFKIRFDAIDLFREQTKKSRRDSLHQFSQPGVGKPGSSAFSVEIRRMPIDSAIRIGWISEQGDLLVGQSQEGWGYHASRCYGTGPSFIFIVCFFHVSPLADD